MEEAVRVVGEVEMVAVEVDLREVDASEWMVDLVGNVVEGAQEEEEMVAEVKAVAKAVGWEAVAKEVAAGVEEGVVVRDSAVVEAEETVAEEEEMVAEVAAMEEVA